MVDSLNSVSVIFRSGNDIDSLEHMSLHCLHRNTLTMKVYLPTDQIYSNTKMLALYKLPTKPIPGSNKPFVKDSLDS